MGLFGGGDQVTKQTTVPWDTAQPYLKNIMSGAQGLYNKGTGFNAPNFQTWVPMSGATTGALSGMMGVAKQGNPLAGMSMDAISGILGGDTNAKYNDLYAHSGNDAFAQNVQNQSDLIANDVQRQFSGLGRTGSAADTGALVQQLGDYRTKAMSDNWNQNIANQRGILGDQSQGQLAAVGAAPGAYGQQYAPYERMAQVGSAYDDLATRKLQAQTDRFNTTQSAPWQRLQALQGAVTGSSSGTGSSTSTVKQPSNWLGGALGGALGGGSMFGVPGAIGGGILGLLSGL